MEGWDGTPEGAPSHYTERRWLRFGQSGAKLIWGCEAVAVCREGRANPNQLWIHKSNLGSFAELRERLRKVHRERFGSADDLVVGLQITHSGRFCRPNRKDLLEPKILYHHPVLDRRLSIPPDYPALLDSEVSRIVDHFIEAARLAFEAGFDFVDVKHCHGYLGHEFLTAVDRPGPYGGSFENRTRFLREVVAGIRAAGADPGLCVRLSVFDTVPYGAGVDGVGRPDDHPTPYRHAFGCDPADATMPDLQDAVRFIDLLRTLDIRLVGVSAGSPYYNPHIQRPALFPPSDGYEPPEDPLVGVARQIIAAAELKNRFPDVLFVGSGYTYLQDYLPHVAQAVIRNRWTDFVGVGRMVLAYHDLPADIMEGRPVQRSRLCRTFSDCTTAPRNGMISGCFPLDPFYRELPEAEQLKNIKSRKAQPDNRAPTPSEPQKRARPGP
jgi:2,4-dienoyl-CoA reductase-like NADH-dependent reductase (Old Yellow Enzyme family)